MSDDEGVRVAVVVPCYRVKRHILDVVAAIGPEVEWIVVVDDWCPEATHEHLAQRCVDPRLHIVRNSRNLGVGGSMLAGYAHAFLLGADICVKVDGDGQMNPALLPLFIAPLMAQEADYAKGNRFFWQNAAVSMPWLRRLGNIGLSFITRISSGYWQLFDPTNGYTAITKEAFAALDKNAIHRRYFFESDMLLQLRLIGAVVQDVPMEAVYADEQSNLSVAKALPSFAWLNLRNAFKRILMQYFVRDFSIASLELLAGLILVLAGLCIGLPAWWTSFHTGQTASSGTVMLAALPVMLGFQLLLAFLGQDLQSAPTKPISGNLRRMSLLQSKIRSGGMS